MSSIKKCEDVDLKKINYSKPEKIGQSYFAPFSYGETLSPLYIQTPKVNCLTTLSEMAGKKSPYIEVEIPHGKLDLYDLFLSLDDQNVKTTVQKSKEWFNKELPLEAIDDMYKRTTKPFKKNTNPSLRFRLPCVKNEIKCGIYNQKKVFIDINDVKEDSEIILILHIRGLKILKTYYYCDCYVSQIKVFQDNESKYNIIPNYSIIDSDDDYEHIFDEEIIQSANEIIQKKEEEQRLKEEEEQRLKEEEEEEEEQRLKEEEEQRLKEEEEQRLKEQKEEEQRLEEQRLEEEKKMKVEKLQKEIEEKQKEMDKLLN